MAAAVSRERAGYEGQGAFHAEQRLTNLEAFQASTWNNKVSIEVGLRGKRFSALAELVALLGWRYWRYLHRRQRSADCNCKRIAFHESAGHAVKRPFHAP